MKKLLLILIAFSSAFYSKAQDILTTKQGQEMLVKVLEITPELVHYKKFDNPEGPVISVQKQEVAEIKYQNGTVEKFAAATVPFTTEKLKPRPIRRNGLAINLLPLIFKSYNLMYDHRLAGKPNVAISVAAGVWDLEGGLFTSSDQETSVTGAAKFFIQQSDFYASPYLKYRHTSSRQNTTWNQFGGGGTIGARHVFDSGILIDYFLGAGIYGVNIGNMTKENERYSESYNADYRLGLAFGFAF